MSETNPRQLLDFGYNRFADLYYYLLAHVPLDNAADVYDPEFAAEMAGSLGIHPLIPQRVTDYYRSHFDRVAISCFMPLVTDNTRHCREALAACGRLTDENMESFVDPMMEVCERVADPFYAWWEETHREAAQRKQKVYDCFNTLAGKFRPFLEHMGGGQKILFSYTLRRNGRAFRQPGGVTVYLKFPEEDKEIAGCFLQFLHECTHGVTDPLLDRMILMEDGSHDLSEYQVLVFDDFLVRNLYPELLDVYRKWIGEDLLSESFRVLGDEGSARMEKLAGELSRIS
jgi:hypothetical protein